MDYTCTRPLDTYIPHPGLLFVENQLADIWQRIFTSNHENPNSSDAAKSHYKDSSTLVNNQSVQSFHTVFKEFKK